MTEFRDPANYCIFYQVSSMSKSSGDKEIADGKLEQVYDDLADHEGKLSKKKVLEATQCLGFNPLRSQVDDWCLAFTGDFLDLKEFKQVVESAAKEPEIEEDEIVESLAVFDLDGEGWLPVAQLKHLMCTNFGSESETLKEEEFDFLISHIKKTEEDFIQYKDFANILSKKYPSI